MSLRIPSNQIKYNYTVGGEFVYSKSYKDYQGHYYELNNNFFVGKEFSINAPVLIKKDSDKINILKTNPETFRYANVSRVTISNDQTKPFPFVYQQYKETSVYTNRYFYSKINSNPIIIKETNEESFNKLKSNPLYKIVVLKWNNNNQGENSNILKEAEKIIPGITAFLDPEDNGDGSEFTIGKGIY